MGENSLSENGVASGMCPEVAIQYGQNHDPTARLECGTCSTIKRRQEHEVRHLLGDHARDRIPYPALRPCLPNHDCTRGILFL